MKEVDPEIKIISRIAIVGRDDHEEIECYHGNGFQIPIERIIAAHMLASSMDCETVRVTTCCIGDGVCHEDLIEIVSESSMKGVN